MEKNRHALLLFLLIPFIFISCDPLIIGDESIIGSLKIYDGEHIFTKDEIIFEIKFLEEDLNDLDFETLGNQYIGISSLDYRRMKSTHKELINPRSYLSFVIKIPSYNDISFNYYDYFSGTCAEIDVSTFKIE